MAKPVEKSATSETFTLYRMLPSVNVLLLNSKLENASHSVEGIHSSSHENCASIHLRAKSRRESVIAAVLISNSNPSGFGASRIRKA